MNNRYVWLWIGIDEPMQKVRKSQLPDGAVRCGHNTFEAQHPWKPERFGPQPPRGGTGRVKASPRPGIIRLWGDAEFARHPWQPVSKLRWRHAGKAKRHVARVSRRKIRTMLRTSDPDGDANFKQAWGITVWDIY